MHHSFQSLTKLHLYAILIVGIAGAIVLSRAMQTSELPCIDDLPWVVPVDSPVEYLENFDRTLAPGYLIQNPGTSPQEIFVQFDVPPLQYGDLPSDYWESWFQGWSRVHYRYEIEYITMPVNASFIERLFISLRSRMNRVPIERDVIHVQPPLFYFSPTSSSQIVVKKLTDTDVEVCRAAQELLNSYGLRPLRRTDIGLLLSNLERQLDAAVLENDDGAMALERARILRDVVRDLDGTLYSVGEPYYGFHTREDGVNWLREVRAELQRRE